MFTLPAAIGNTGKFQQITEPDMFVPELKLADLHGIPESQCRNMILEPRREGTITPHSVRTDEAFML